MKKIIAGSMLFSSLSVLFCVLFFGGLCPQLPVWAGVLCAWAGVVAVTLLFGVLFLRRKREEEPAGACPPDPDPEPETGPALAPGVAGSVGKRGYEVFLRAVRYMEEKRPYLDEKLGLEQFAKAIFSNKVYVSKNINYYSGKNFRQFVNWYRIRHAVELMEADPHLRMEEVSMLSGFHSTVSFNMAFRLFEGKTPTQWQEAYVESLRKR